MSSRAAKADIISIFLHWTKYPVHLPLWLANTAHCLMSYIYSADAVDQTLKIKQLTLSFLLPKCHSVNMSGCSPKANLARAQGSRIKNASLYTDQVRAHSLAPEQTSLHEGDFQAAAELSHMLHSTRLSSLGMHPLPQDAFQSQALKCDSNATLTQTDSQIRCWRLNSHLHG